jgi:hypothetical protein
MKHAGIYTGKFQVGQRVHSGDTYTSGRYDGTILKIQTERRVNNAYGVQWDGEVYDDGTPLVFWYSETDIVLI